MDGDDREARATRSVALFNNRYFADVSNEVLRASHDGQDVVVTTRMIASLTGLSDSLVRPVLLRLVDAGVLDKLPRMGGGRSPQYYAVREPDTLERVQELSDIKGTGRAPRLT